MRKIFSKKDILNANWLIAEKIIQLFFAILIIPQVFNTLGALDIGKLEYAKSLIGMLVPFLFLGLSAVAVKEIIENPKQVNVILATIFTLRLISCFLVLLGLVSFVYFTGKDENTTILLILGLAYFIKLSDVFVYFFEARKKASILFVARILAMIILFLAKYIGVKQKLGVHFFAWLISLEFLIHGLIYLMALSKFKEVVLKKWRFSLDTAVKVMKPASFLIFTGFVIAFYISIDELFLKYYHGNSAVGIFGVVQFLVIYLSWSIGEAFIVGVFPGLVEVYREDKRLYDKRIVLGYQLVIFFGFLIGLIFTFFSDYFIYTFYSESFYQAILPLKIFSWSPLFIFTGVLYQKHLVITNKLNNDIYRFLLGCIINGCLCYLLIPKYHVVGASVAVLGSHIVSNIGFILVFKEGRNYFKRVFFLTD